MSNEGCITVAPKERGPEKDKQKLHAAIYSKKKKN